MILKRKLSLLYYILIILLKIFPFKADLENGFDYYKNRESLLPRKFQQQKNSKLIVKRSNNDNDNDNDNDFCSSFCLCDTWFKLRRAKCNNRYLFSVETGVSNNVQALDLSYNSVSSLHDYELKNIGLVNLKYLNLSDNSINQIGSFAFFGIDKLTVLDLSNNHLYYILWDTFVESFNLRIIHLNGNRFGTGIPELHSNSILELGLNNCQISYVNDKIFYGLKKLERLDLSKNNMIHIDYRLINYLPMLKEINLNDNPWSCKTDTIKNLLNYFDEKLISYKISSCEFNDDNKILLKKLKNFSTKKFEKITDIRSESSIDEEIDDDRVSEKKNNIDAWLITESQSSKPCFSSEIINSNKSNNRIDSVSGLIDALSTISPILLLATGFSIGLVSSMLGTYIWLTGSFSCSRCPAIHRRGNNVTQPDNGSQRVSLLGPPICPGTPPPPYRDVVLL